jgi:hypothetical protein
MIPQASRAFRSLAHSCKSSTVPEATPFLHNVSSQQSLDLDYADLEAGALSGDKGPKVCTEACSDTDDEYLINPICLNETSPSPRRFRWQWGWRIPSLYKTVFGRSESLRNNGDKRTTRPGRRKPSALRRTFHVIGFLLMLL